MIPASSPSFHLRHDHPVGYRDLPPIVGLDVRCDRVGGQRFERSRSYASLAAVVLLAWGRRPPCRPSTHQRADGSAVRLGTMRKRRKRETRDALLESLSSVSRISMSASARAFPFRSLPLLVLGNPKTKSIEISAHGIEGTGRGIYKPCGCKRDLPF